MRFDIFENIWNDDSFSEYITKCLHQIWKANFGNLKIDQKGDIVDFKTNIPYSFISYNNIREIRPSDISAFSKDNTTKFTYIEHYISYIDMHLVTFQDDILILETYSSANRTLKVKIYDVDATKELKGMFVDEIEKNMIKNAKDIYNAAIDSYFSPDIEIEISTIDSTYMVKVISNGIIIKIDVVEIVDDSSFYQMAKGLVEKEFKEIRKIQSEENNCANWQKRITTNNI